MYSSKMIQYYLFLAISTIIIMHCPMEADGLEGSTPQDIARNFLPELCPEINALNGNKALKEDSMEGLESCCTYCSYDPSCDVNNICCFPQESLSTLQTSDSDRKCLYPTVSQHLSSRHRLLYPSFWMVTDVKSYGNDMGHSNQSNTKCGDVQNDSLGSLIPVSSKKTEKIYKNSVCAEADNVNDGVLWDILLICKQTQLMTQTKNVSSFISKLYLASSPDNCRIHFRYPSHIDEILSERCFKNLIHTCPNENFTIPQSLNLTMSQVRQACTSGLVSPYLSVDIYQNVFCHICNNNKYTGKEKCYDGGKALFGNFISILSDVTSLSESLHILKEKEDAPLACPQQYTGEKIQESCRQVHCPSGQQWDKYGNCLLLVKKWYMEKCDVYLKLSSDFVFDVEDIFQDNVLSLRHKWPSNWQITSVSRRVQHTTIHNNLYVLMTNIFPQQDTIKLLRNIQRLLKTNWILTFSNGTSISMSAELGFVTMFFNLNSVKVIIYQRQEGKGEHNEIPFFSTLYSKGLNTNDETTLIVTKLYFCEQIGLNPSEYELREGNILYNNMTNKLLFFGEFTIVTSPNFVDEVGVEKKERARICLDDSGFIKLRKKNVISKSDQTRYVCCTVLTAFFASLLVW